MKLINEKRERVPIALMNFAIYILETPLGKTFVIFSINHQSQFTSLVVLPTLLFFLQLLCAAKLFKIVHTKNTAEKGESRTKKRQDCLPS